MEAIDSIKIVQVDGLTNGGGKGGSPVSGGGSGNLATDAVSAALAYRAQAPVLDGLMKELGLDGSSLDGLVKGGAAAETTPRLAEVLEDIADQVEEAEAKDGGKDAPPAKESAPAE